MSSIAPTGRPKPLEIRAEAQGDEAPMVNPWFAKPNVIRSALWAVIACIVCLSMLSGLLSLYLDIEVGGRMFAVNQEANLPTWFSSTLLSACAFSALIVATRHHAVQHGTRIHWLALAALMLFLSLDETAMIHERFGAIGSIIGEFEAVYEWVFVGAALVVLVGWAFLPFLARLPRPVAERYVLAGALYVGGALGLEVVAGVLNFQLGEGYDVSLGKLLLTHLEEALEMIGAAVFLLATLALLRTFGTEDYRREIT